MEPEVLETDNPTTENTIDPLTLPVEDLIHYEEEVNELYNLSKTADKLGDIIQEGNEVGEDVYEKIEAAKKTLEEKADEIDPLDTVITQESIRVLRKRLGMEDVSANFNFEDATSNPTLATTMNIEGLREIASTVLQGVQEAWKKLVEFAKAIYKKLTTVVKDDTAKIKALKAKLDDPNFNFEKRLEAKYEKLESEAASIERLEAAVDALDDVSKHPLYNSLIDLFTYDCLGGSEYLKKLNVMLETLPNVLAKLTDLIKPDVTIEELGITLETVFAKAISATNDIKVISNIKKAIEATAYGEKLPLNNVCLLAPKSATEFVYVATAKDGDKIVYKNQSELDIKEADIKRIRNIDTLATDTSKALSIINLEQTDRIYKTLLSATDLVTRKINVITTKHELSDEAKRVIRQIMLINSTILRMPKEAFDTYRLIFKRAKIIASL